jgi:hypothetical protein
MILDNSMIVNYDCNRRFIVLATINMMLNYDCKTFIVQATGVHKKHIGHFKTITFILIIKLKTISFLA